jgi:DNA-binding transcriptional LysR family regulator
MNIKTLKIFLDLVDRASFSKTAKQNGVSQSAISQKIKVLEIKLNVNLLEKKQKTFQLTPEGIVFHRHAQAILSEYETMIKNLHSYDSKILGNVHLLTSYWIGIYLLPNYVRDYLKVSKNFDLDINYGDYNRMQTAISDLWADLIILEYPLSHDEFISEQFFEDEFVAVGLEQSISKGQQIFSFANLESLPLIGFTKHHPLRSIFEKAIEKKIKRPHYFMELNQIELIKQAIEIHNGIAILPRSTIFSSPNGQHFKAIPLKNIRIPIPLYFSYREKRKMNRAMERFIEILKRKPLIY